MVISRRYTLQSLLVIKNETRLVKRIIMVFDIIKMEILIIARLSH